MTGGGFGGCVVALLRPEKVAEVIAVVEAEYPARFWPGRTVTSAVPAQGPADCNARLTTGDAPARHSRRRQGATGSRRGTANHDEIPSWKRGGTAAVRSRIRGHPHLPALPGGGERRRCCWVAPTRPTPTQQVWLGPWRAFCQPHRRRPPWSREAPVLDAGRQPGGQLPARRARRVPSPHLADQGAGGGQGQAGAPLPGGDQGFPGNLRVSLEYRLGSAIWWSTSAPARGRPQPGQASPATPTSTWMAVATSATTPSASTPTATCPRMTSRACRWPSPRWKGPFDQARPAPSARRGWTTPAAVGQGYDHAFLLNNSDFEPADEPFGVQPAMGRPG